MDASENKFGVLVSQSLRDKPRATQVYLYSFSLLTFSLKYSFSFYFAIRFLAFPILTQVVSFTSTQHACTIKVQIKPRPGRIHQRDKMRLFTRQLQPSPEMKERVTGVERIVGYDFMDKTLLEEALTHPSSCRPKSYQRLELLGDSALNHAVTKYLFLDSRKFNEDEITNRRKDTVSNPYLARIGARLGLYDYLLRYNTPDLDDQVFSFPFSFSCLSCDFCAGLCFIWEKRKTKYFRWNLVGYILVGYLCLPSINSF